MHELCYLDEIIIEGQTTAGITFRPSDWVDRLCGTLAEFDQQKFSFSPYLRPMIYNDMQCVAIKKDLATHLPVVFAFLMQFATDNQLVITECSALKIKARIDNSR